MTANRNDHFEMGRKHQYKKGGKIAPSKNKIEKRKNFCGGGEKMNAPPTTEREKLEGQRARLCILLVEQSPSRQVEKKGRGEESEKQRGLNRNCSKGKTRDSKELELWQQDLREAMYSPDINADRRWSHN